MNLWRRHFDTNKYAYLIAFICALVIWISSPINPLIGDAATYGEIAQNIAEKGEFQSNFQAAVDEPVFPLILAGFMKLFDNQFEKFYLSFIVFVFILSTYFLTREFIRNNKKAIFTILILLSLSLVIYHMLQPLTDIMALTLMNFSALFYTKYLKQPQKKMLIFSGIIAGLLVLTRTAGIIFVTALLLHLFVKNILIQKKYNLFLINTATFILT